MKNWLLFLLFRKKAEHRLDAELRFHLDQQIREYMASGISAEEAGRRANLDFGGLDQIKEECRDARPMRWMEDLLQDARYGCRVLVKRPGFTLVAVLSLALGVGVNTAIFRVVDRLLFQPIPVPESNKLMSLQTRSRNSALYDTLCFPEYLYYRDQNNVFTGLAAHEQVRTSFGRSDQPTAIEGEIVSANYFETLGIAPAIGRWFHREEDQIEGGTSVVVIGQGLWRRAFNADPTALGKEITINRHSFTVIGVAPKGFAGLPGSRGLPRSEFWIPISMFRQVIPGSEGGLDLLHMWGNQWVHATGRLKPKTSPMEAERLLQRTTGQLHEKLSEEWGAMNLSWPDNPSARTAALVPSSETRIPPSERHLVITSLWLLIGIAVIVLFIACVNISSLMLQRSLNRQREIALRFSLGATRGRIFRQLFVESMVLAALGAAAGFLVASGASSFLLNSTIRIQIPPPMGTELDTRLLAFAVATSILCTAISGFLPIKQAGALDLASAIKTDSVGLTSDNRKFRLRDLLLAGQVVFAVVLLAGAGLFVRTLINMRATDVTVNPAHVLLTQLNLPKRISDESPLFYRNLLARLQSLPGIKSAALVLVPPLGGTRGGTNIKTSEGEVQVDFNIVSPSYFDTVGTPIMRGRGFADADRVGTQPVALINEPFARQFFAGQNAIGRSFQLTFPGMSQAEVVGIVKDGPFKGARDLVKPCIYLPIAQFEPIASALHFVLNMSLEVRTLGDSAAFIPAIRREIIDLDQDIPIDEILTLKSHRETGLARERMIAQLLTGLAMFALILAAIGIYGLISFTAAQRTREIGIRIALGAPKEHVLRLVLGGTLALVSAAIAVGTAGAMALASVISNLLLGVSARDPLTFCGISVLILVTSLAAAYYPTRHALEISPTEALRYE
jgi:predicted permease